jgi:hypothetical protein
LGVYFGDSGRCEDEGIAAGDRGTYEGQSWEETALGMQQNECVDMQESRNNEVE